MNSLTPEQTTLREVIRSAFDRRLDADVHYQNLMKQCTKHVFVDINDSAHCAVCGHHGGWYCPDSPDHRCEYDLNDICNFCGNPDERK